MLALREYCAPLTIDCVTTRKCAQSPSQGLGWCVHFSPYNDPWSGWKYHAVRALVVTADQWLKPHGRPTSGKVLPWENESAVLVPIKTFTWSVPAAQCFGG